MADHSLPQLSSTYADFLSFFSARISDVALGLDPAFTTVTNPPTNALRFSSAATKWQRWNGTSWVDAATTYAIAITGNAGTATALQTSRAINGTSFNGSADITTANWGTARTVTLGSTGKSVNGSANVSWTLAEIGAASADATVNLTGDQSVGGNKTFTGLQAWNGTGVHAYGNVVSTYTGYFSLGGRGFRKVTSGHAIEVVNNANSAVTHTLADNGDFTAAGNVTAYSDERLKKDWADLDSRKVVDGLAWVRSGAYTRADTGARQLGVSAQSLRMVMPEVVSKDDKGFLSVAYGNAALVAAVALAQEVEALRARVASLEGR